MNAKANSTAELDTARRSLRAATVRGSSGRAIIRARSEGFLFKEVCRTVVAADYIACSIHERGRPSNAYTLVESSGLKLSSRIELPEPPRGVLIQRPGDPTAGDLEDASVARFVMRPSGGRILLLSICSRDEDAFNREELGHLRELSRDMVSGLEALKSRSESAPGTGPVAFGPSARSRAPSQANGALREQLEMIRSIADSAQDAILMIDDKGRISYWNRVAEKVFGWTAEEAIGKDLHPMLAPQKFHESIEASFLSFVETGQGAIIGRTTELTGLRKGGTEFPLELSLGRARVRGSWQAVGIIRDITDHKRVLEDLERAKIEAEHAAEAKTLFLANVSHEIRTPLNAVIGMAALLLDTDLDNQQEEFARIIHRSGEILLSVINDILDFSKMDADGLEFEVIPFSVRACVEDVGDLLGQKAAGKGLELVILIDHQVPRRVAGDSGRLRQVLTNLINNAIKFTEAGEIVLRVGLIDSGDRSDRLVFSVEDTGIGIPADNLDALFQPFTQVDASTTRRFGGTGLGLSIARSLVERMGGDLKVESRVGEGTVFRFEASFESGPQDEEAPPVRHGTLEGMTVLIVDDNLTNRRLLEELLGRWGCSTRSVVSGQDALDLLLDPDEMTDFDLAILDFSMPSMDGATLALAIRSEAQLAEMPLILLTSMPEFGDGEKMKEIGFDAYLTKPVRQSFLYDAILSVTADQEPPVVGGRSMVTRHTLSEARRSRLRILVTEDNIFNQKVACRMLENLGYRCDVANNGQEALDALELKPYDVVFMDCQMPVMDGFEATRRIRLIEGEGRRTSIIATTAGALKGDRDNCIEAGMDDYVSKPIDLDELGAVLERFGGSPTVDDLETPEPDGAAPVEVSRLQAIARGDRVFERRILELFLEESGKRLECIDRALEDEDFEALRLEAHTLKGSSGNIGADRVADLAARLREAAEVGERASCEEISDSLVRASASTSRWLEAYLRKMEQGESEPTDD